MAQACASSVDYSRASDVLICALAESRAWASAEKELAALHKKMKKQALAPIEEGEAVAKALSKLKAPKVIKLMRQGGR